MKRYLLDFEYILFDTNRRDWEAAASSVAREHLFALTALLLMKAASHQDLSLIWRILELWEEIGVIRDRELFLFGMIYIVETQDITLDDLKEFLEEHQIEGEDIMPTLAQRLREEGYKKGIQEGIQKGIQEGIQKGIERGKQEGILLDRQHVLVMLLSMRFQLTEEEKQRIYSVKDGQRLEEALKMIFTAQTKDEILSFLGKE
ncbi:MAG: hypothetical protein D6681_07310 [Calditrichaeota bacterium]|nr:MAG: hypothetical protein D6681_07310 [Calditrichota bacterium]